MNAQEYIQEVDRSLDQKIIPALQAAAKFNRDAWRQELDHHRRHPGFEAIQNVQARQIGFACSCSGQRMEHFIDIRELKELLPEARASAQRILLEQARKGTKERRRKARKAVKRSEALLFRYLTKEQKWSLRAGKFFSLTGKDGHRYEIHANANNNVYRYDEQGKLRYRFCIITQYAVPVYDLMLAQKILLETNPRKFLDTSVVRDLIIDDWWNNGKHIDNPGVEPVPSHKQRVAVFRERVESAAIVPHEDLEGVEYLRAIDHLNQLSIQNLLVADIGMTDQVCFTDIDPNAVAFVLNENLDVVPSYDRPCVVPKLDDTDWEDRILKLITGVPAAVYKSVAACQAHFVQSDLCWQYVLVHPDTDREWARRQDPIWHDMPTILGVRKIKDKRIPKGRAWYVADAETVGMHVSWYDTPHRGYCIFNLNGVAVYEPNGRQEAQEEATEAQGTIQTALQASDRDRDAERILRTSGVGSDELD